MKWLQRLSVASCLIIASTTLGCSATSPDAIDPPPAALEDCHWLGISGPDALASSERVTLSVFRQFCRPNFLPLTNDQVSWRSVDAAVATVSNGVVSAVAPGAAVIEATFGVITQQKLIVITGATSPSSGSTRLRIVGAPSMTVTQRGFFVAFVEMADRSIRVVPAQWQSSDAGTLSLLAAGVEQRQFDALRSGSARVTANAEGLTATFDVVIRPQ